MGKLSWKDSKVFDEESVQVAHTIFPPLKTTCYHVMDMR